MRCSDFLIYAVAVALLAAPLAAFGQNREGVIRVFSCEVNGRPVFGDTLPKECYGHAWVEKINGIVVYREAAQPTADESARRKKLAQEQELAQKEAARQKRQNDALLERYPTLSDLDRRRDEELAELDKVIASLRADEERLSGRRSNLEEEAKALNGKPVPADLTKAISYANEELAQAKKAIERKTHERDSLRQRFDDDRQLYIEITSSAPKKE